MNSVAPLDDERRKERAARIETFRDEFLKLYHPRRKPGNLTVAAADKLFELLRDSVRNGHNQSLLDMEAFVTALGTVDRHSVEKALERFAVRLRCFPFDATYPKLKKYAKELEDQNRWQPDNTGRVRIFGPLSKHRDTGRVGTVGLLPVFPEDDAYQHLPEEVAPTAKDLEDTPHLPRRSPISFSDFLHGYSEHLPPEQRQERLLELLDRAWDETLFQPVQAVQMLEHPPSMVAIATVTTPLARAALRQSIPDDELRNLLTVVASMGHPRRLTVDVAAVVNRFCARLFRHLAYSQPDAFRLPCIRTFFGQLVTLGHAFWERFCADLHLRSAYGLLTLNEETERLLAIGMIGYRKRIRGTPIEFAWEAIASPLDFVQSRSYPRAFDDLASAARSATYPFEAQICLFAFDRVLPLYDESGERPEESEATARFFDAIPRKLVDQSTGLQHSLLTRLLWSFVRDRRRNFDRLREFERKFERYCIALNPLQRSHLQLEYGASLYVALQTSNTQRTQQLSFTQQLDTGVSLLESPLFSNDFVRWGGLATRPSHTDRRSVSAWLQSYCGKLIRQYCAPILAREALHLAAFKASAELPMHRSYLASTVATSLSRKLPNATANYCAYALSLMPLAGQKLAPDSRRRTALRAASSDEYTLRRMARFIAGSLWRLHLYDDSGVPSELADDFFARALPDDRPRFILIYESAINYSETTRDFIEALCRQCTMSAPDGVESRQRGESDIFSSEIRRVSREYSRQSRLASVVLEFLDESEIWNVLGRTVERSGINVFDFEKAAFLYNTAAFMGRRSRHGNAGFELAALRCRCEATKRSSSVDERYLVNASRFLADNRVKSKKQLWEFTRDFERLLKNVWHQLTATCRESISMALRSVKGIDMENIAAEHERTFVSLMQHFAKTQECSSCGAGFMVTEAEIRDLHGPGVINRFHYFQFCRSCRDQVASAGNEAATH